MRTENCSFKSNRPLDELNVCGSSNEFTCCTAPEWLNNLIHKLPSPPTCGFDLQNKIVGGDKTEINEFSWAVLLEYGIGMLDQNIVI